MGLLHVHDFWLRYNTEQDAGTHMIQYSSESYVRQPGSIKRIFFLGGGFLLPGYFWRMHHEVTPPTSDKNRISASASVHSQRETLMSV
jgi:hypothetical protein